MLKTAALAAALTAAALLHSAACLAADSAGPLLVEDGVIDTDTVWSGDVLVKGPCVVKKGATLTITPGTTVRFVRVDADGDGIGDGELNVEGALMARGTKDKPITFESAEAEPGDRDWTYIMFSHSAKSTLEYCVVHNAFTAAQVHWSNVDIINDKLSGNFEGLRFSTAVVEIKHNDITGNGFGIRYESRGSTARITDNNVTGNGCGFFAVTKCEGDVVITDNNISNTDYNVKLGDRQDKDVVFAGNWWGTAKPEAIEGMIFDGRAEPGIGKVDYGQYRQTPVKGAGVE